MAEHIEHLGARKVSQETSATANLRRTEEIRRWEIIISSLAQRIAEVPTVSSATGTACADGPNNAE